MKGVDCRTGLQLDSLADAAVDIVGPQLVQVSVSSDGDRVWVNVNGVCVLRAALVGRIEVEVGGHHVVAQR